MSTATSVSPCCTALHASGRCGRHTGCATLSCECLLSYGNFMGSNVLSVSKLETHMLQREGHHHMSSTGGHRMRVGAPQFTEPTTRIIVLAQVSIMSSATSSAVSLSV